MFASSTIAADDDPIAALAAIEHAASFVASDTAQLLGGLQASLQSLSHASVDYMAVYHDTTLHTRDVLDESLANGRSFIQKCILLDHRMAGVEQLACQLSEIDRALIALEVAFRRVPE
ncbi:hypothetical protein Ctob_008788 [Chrysochromulina tobinii]|uniref:BLOC-1-related complex subunit 6 C-terminal helix domain-containing protein n=1 Tax=Chrysochromulina tobinii TaxID=1460289 RepID=A0A0M0JSF7_9EUKA|nr:hypothetical protein Ctob_008788 [Chrysochromulina tobinii]|eukprot:KOO29138.1 hypothetical protein Ctob_008788 [Chrysochromulina sp. CCMP291]